MTPTLRTERQLLVGHAEIKLTEVCAAVAAPNEASPTLPGRIGFERVRDIEEDDGGTTRVPARRPATTDRSP